MLKGEYNSMISLFETAPTFVPTPCTWCQLNVSNLPTYFFLDMNNDEPPGPTKLCTKLIALHCNSVSPNGKFGFQMNTYQSNLPQQTAPWQDSWKDSFTQLSNGATKHNRDIDCPWKNLEECSKRLISHVVPVPFSVPSHLMAAS
jgi:fructosamine-3-kinase